MYLANFQLEKDPLGFTKNGKNSDCVAIGELALYMLSKDLRSNTAFKGQLLWSQKRENMVEMPSGYMIDASMSLSTGLIDFLDTCMRESDDLEALINVSTEGKKLE
jgi:hypothetical protein